MSRNKLLAAIIVLCPVLVAGAITHAFPDGLKTYHPTYLKQLLFHTAVLAAVWASLALAKPGLLGSLRACAGGSGPLWLLAAYLVLLVLSPLWSASPGLSALSAADGVFCLVWAGVVSLWARRDGHAGWLAWSVAGAALLAGTWGLLDFLLPVLGAPAKLSDPAYRLMRPLGNPNFSAALLGVGLVLLVARMARRGTSGSVRLAIGLGVVVLGVALFWTRSGAGFVALPLGLAALLFLKCPPRARWAFLAAGLIACTVATHLLSSSHSAVSRRLMRVAMAPGSTAHARPLLWMAAVDMIRERPAFGHGAGAFLCQHPAHRPALANLYRWGSDAHFDIHAHNEWIEAAVELGLVGLVLYLWLLAAAVRAAWKRASTLWAPSEAWAVEGAIAGLVVLHAQGMFSVGLRYWDLAPYHWTLVGLLISRSLPADASEPTQDCRPNRWIAVVAGAACLCLWVLLPGRGYASQVHTLNAVRAAKAGQHAASAGHFLTALEHATYYVDVVRDRLLLGRVMARIPDGSGLSAAIEHLLQVDAHAPGFAQCRLLLGTCFLRQGRYRDAVRWLESYLRGNPFSAPAHRALATAYVGIGQRAAARGEWPPAGEAFRSALQHDPLRVDAAAHLALCEAEQGHGGEAGRWLEWLSRKRIESPDVAGIIHRAQLKCSGP